MPTHTLIAPAQARAFYQDLLGFRLSDIIHMQFGPDVAFDMEFFHCNPRHHTVALVPMPAPRARSYAARTPVSSLARTSCSTAGNTVG